MTDIVSAPFINSTAPAATGVWDETPINEYRGAINSKLDKVGGVVFVTAAPVAGDGVDGQYRFNTVTSLLHLKTAGSWDAGVEFAAPGADGEDGANGISYDLQIATTEPADVDKVAGALYAVMGSPTPTSKASASGVTYTAAELLSNIIVRDCAGAGRTDTLPTAALLVAAMPGTTKRVGAMVTCLIVNGSDANEVITIAAGVGGSFDTNQNTASRIIPQNASKRVHIRLTNVGSGTETYKVYL